VPGLHQLADTAGAAAPWPIRIVLEPPSSNAGVAGSGEPATTQP